MGVGMVLVVLVLIMTSGPGAMKAPVGAEPGALAEGGGALPIEPRAGVGVIDIAAPDTTATGVAPTRTVSIAGVTMSADAQHGGIPSAAASERLALVDGGGGEATAMPAAGAEPASPPPSDAAAAAVVAPAGSMPASGTIGAF